MRPERTNVPSYWINCDAITTSCMSHESVKRSKRWVRKYFHSPWQGEHIIKIQESFLLYQSPSWDSYFGNYQVKQWSYHFLLLERTSHPSCSKQSHLPRKTQESLSSQELILLNRVKHMPLIEPNKKDVHYFKYWKCVIIHGHE